MKNETHINGNENIVIQDVKESNITISVGGRQQTLEIAMNEWLVEKAMPAVSRFNVLAGRFLKSEKITAGWPKQQNYRNAALTILQSAYIGVVGIFLNKLAAISNERFSEKKKQDYVKNAYFLALRLLDFCNALMLSALWDFSLKQKPALNAEQEKLITAFFDQNIERNMAFSLALLRALAQVFKTNGMDLPWAEAPDLTQQLRPESTLSKGFEQVAQLYQKSQKTALTGEDCFWTEQHLSEILEKFAFLAKYKIQSVKEVDYHHIRLLEEFFIHRTSFYGLSSKRTEKDKLITEEIQHSSCGISTDAVLVFEQTYTNGRNLFPFVVDYNNVLQERGTNLCVFSHREMAFNQTLNYISLADNNFLAIEASGEPISNNFSEIYAETKTIVQHKKDIVEHLLAQARKSILGKGTENADDFLETLID